MLWLFFRGLSLLVCVSVEKIKKEGKEKFYRVGKGQALYAFLLALCGCQNA
jgi:hypothetical protein